MPTTSQPRRAAASAALPLPVATSRTRQSARRSTASQRSLGHGLDQGGDRVEVAARPHRLLALLDRLEIGRDRFCRAHVVLLRFVVGVAGGREHALERDRRPVGRLVDRLGRLRLDEEEAGLVLRDEDRPDEPDRPSLRRQRGGGTAGTPGLAVGAVGAGSGDVQLDEELGHAGDGRARRIAAKLPIPPVFSSTRPQCGYPHRRPWAG